MTEKELKAIEDRCAAATPGPWRQHSYATEVVAEVGEDDVCVADCNIDGTRVGGGTVQQSHDADFIAYARTDVPALLAEVRRLTALYNDTHSYASGAIVRLRERAEAAEAVAAGLRGLIKQAISLDHSSCTSDDCDWLENALVALAGYP